MPLDPPRIKALFHAALDLPDPADRPTFLDRECGDDMELRHRLEELLAAYDRPASALERPFAVEREPITSAADETAASGPAPGGADATATVSGPGPGATAPPEQVTPLIGLVVAGRYKLRQEIGEGGMGSVYLAEQTRPIRRQVALKLIKPGMDSSTVLARFESERQALALMDHPHIARVLDAGTTEGGRPFFVMDLVRGIPLTDYCDQHRLGLPERLDLFRQICSAVQHAHQKGIIHRDLKPSNILVEGHDGHPVPKVIDFGLAKATSGMQLSEHSLFTAFGSVAGTPLYMAPEQASFNALDVDTRADIYALGVILYELLTGSTPIRRETFRQAAIDEVLRMVREVEPPTPSSRISTSEALPSLAATRQTEPARLSRFVRGDLDWIVMKAMAKERQRRYESASALAQEIERFMHHEPVSAGPPTAAYRFRKFVRRNRPQVIAASLVLLALVAGVVGTTLGLLEAKRQEGVAIAEARQKELARQAEAIQRQQADEQRRQAEKRLAQIEKFNEILGSIFKDLDPKSAEKGGKPLSALLGERLEQATAQIEGEAIGDPLAVARMQRTLGESQLGLGYPERAIDLLGKARATFTTRLGPDHLDTLTSMNKLAEGYLAAGKLDRALPLWEQALALTRTKFGPRHVHTLDAMNSLAEGHRFAGDLVRALPLYEETLALVKAELGPDHPDTLIVMTNLAQGYRDVGRLDRAIPLFEEVLALSKSRRGAEHPETLMRTNELAATHQVAGQPGRAIPLFEESLALLKAKLGPDHPDTLLIMNNLALAYHRAGKPERALPLLEETLARRKMKSGLDHPETLTTMNNLALGYQAAGDLDRALPLFEEVVRAGRKLPVFKRLAPRILEAYTRAGQSGKAAALAMEVLAEARASMPAGSPQLAEVMSQVGRILLMARAWTEAEPVLRESLAIREAKEPDAWTTSNTRSLLGGALLGQKKYPDAAPLLRAGYEGMKRRAEKIPPPGKIRLVEALDRLIELAEATNKPDDVRRWKDEKTKLARASVPIPEAEKK